MEKAYKIVKHLDQLEPKAGDKEKALSDAYKIADFLKHNYQATVYGVGSLFLPGREFTEKSDIDLVTKGLPKGKFFSISVTVDKMSVFPVELIPWEDANDYLRRQAKEEGTLL